VPDAPSSLAGKRMVVTRPVDQCEDLCALLSSRGATPLALPLVAIAPPNDFAPLDSALRSSREFSWLLFTSQNAVRAVAGRCRELGIDPAQHFRHASIAAVGPATAESVRELGLNVAHESAGRTGLSLANELATQLAGKRVFLPRSDRANPDLLEALHHLGARVTQAIAYRALPPANIDRALLSAIARAEVDAVLFFSPSAVRHLADLLGVSTLQQLQDRVALLAIGPVTCAAMQRLGLVRILQASGVSSQGAVLALQDHFVGAEKHHSSGVTHA
jgi:uroporphyrinogen-III synthase